MRLKTYLKLQVFELKEWMLNKTFIGNWFYVMVCSIKGLYKSHSDHNSSFQFKFSYFCSANAHDQTNVDFTFFQTIHIKLFISYW